MKSAIVVFPGTNREQDMAEALEMASGRPPAMVWHRDSALPEADLIVVPGGFSYGDYLRAGAMAAHSPVLRSVAEAAQRGVAVLGVCNGFQILVEAGLLPGALLSNASLKFVCRDIGLSVANGGTMFAACYEAGQVLRMPVAHHDGNYFADTDTLDRLEDEDRIAFRYAPLDGEGADRFNPNGSVRDIAGIYNGSGNVLGMMPHPENAVRPDQGSTDGLGLFTGLVAALGRALDDATAEWPVAVAVVRFLLYTGARKSEALRLKWEHVHGDRAVLPDSKTGPRTLWLASPARAVLAARQRRTNCPWVFASPCGGPATVDKAWNAIRTAAGLPTLRIHDLRHAHAAVAVGGGEGLRVVAGLLGHADIKTTFGYAHLAEDSVFEAANRVSRGLADMLDGGEAGR